jgi:hypothetical protein
MNDIKPQSNIPGENKSFRVEWSLSSFAALNCFLVVVIFAFINNPDQISDFSSQWPFPILYFIEIIAIGIVGFIAVGFLQRQEKSNWSAIFWICSGILLSFVILGAWTIGFFLLPAMVVYLVLGILSDKRTGNDIPRHLIFLVGAGIAQSLIVFLTLIG